MKKNLEMEYTFIIPRSSLDILPDKEIAGFSQTSQNSLLIDDILYGRTPNPLADEKIGVRFRRQDDGYEFTYKKFLGRENGITNYDEYTLDITEKEFVDSRDMKFDNSKFNILDEISVKGNLYLMLEILNRRKVYDYSKNNTKIQLMIEDVQYSDGNKTADDANIEIEICADSTDNEQISEFVEEIKSKYSCEEMDEGKNSRGLRLLEKQC